MGRWVSKDIASGNKYITYRLVVEDGVNSGGKKTVTLYFQGKKSYLSNQYTQGRGTITLWIAGESNVKNMGYPDASLRLIPGKDWITMHKFTRNDIVGDNIYVSGGIKYSNSSISANANSGDMLTNGLDPVSFTYTLNYGEGNVKDTVTINYGDTFDVSQYYPSVIPEGKYWGGWSGPNRYEYTGIWNSEIYNIKTEGNDTIEVLYKNTKGNNISNLIPKPRSGYKFLGWVDEENFPVYNELGEYVLGKYWDDNGNFIKTELQNQDTILIKEVWEIQNIVYIKDDNNEWQLALFYAKDGDKDWNPNIAYVKDDKWYQSIT